jgi:hypothetical protein
MPLFRVLAEVEVMIVAEDEAEAWDAARSSVEKEIRMGSDAFTVESVSEVTDPKNLGDWKGSIPYGGDGNTKCEDVISSLAVSTSKEA